MLQNAVSIPAAPSLRWFCGDAGQGVGVGDDADDDDDGDDEASSHPGLSVLYALYGPCAQLCVHGDDGHDVDDDVFLHLNISRLLGFLFHLRNDREILDLP